MPRPCSICDSPDLAKINAELLKGTPYTEITEQFHIARGTLSRHRQHMQVSDAAMKAAERLKEEEIALVTTGDTDVIGQVRDLGTRAERILSDCEKDKDRKHEIAAMREARGLLELQARLMGRLGPNTAVQVNVDARSLTTAPEWPILMRVLSRHPEIYQELTAELMEAGL